MDVISVLALALGAGATALVAALAVLLQVLRSRRHSVARVGSSAISDITSEELKSFEISSIDFMELMTWNKSRPLPPSSILESVEVIDKPLQEWVDQAGLDRLVARVEAARRYSPACSLVSFESDNVPTLRFNVIRDSYAHYVAIREYLKDESRMAQVRAYARMHSIEQLIAHSPLSVIALNATIIAEGSVLLVKRSNAVSTFRGYWQVGPHKSLAFRPDGKPENALDLARRALKEEAGLEPADYANNIAFSWFGVYLREATP